MNETEIRDRVRQALGDSTYPPDLPHRLMVRLDRPAKGGPSPILGVVAALLVLAIVGTLVFIRLQSPARPLPAASPPPSATPESKLVTNVELPQFDLDQTDLSAAGALVTPMNLTSTDSGRTVTLIGAYADSSEIVLFLRFMPNDQSFPQVKVYDDSGFLNASATGGRGVIGDRYVVVHTGPHPGNDGFAHMRVVVDGFTPDIRGNWTFEFPLRLPASTHLRLSPPATDLGSWKFTIETFEVTPTQVHFQAVIDGAAAADIKWDTISLVKPDGKSPLQIVTTEASALGPQSTRVNVSWRRPVNGDMYFLVISGRNLGGTPINGTSTPAYIKGGGWRFVPTDYPVTTEAITFDGAFSTIVTNAQPASCGVGTGPSGTIFLFGMYFQLNQAWYYINLSTRVGQYTGPGTYDVRAQILPLGGSAIFDGTVRLTVTSDRGPSPFTGSVRGSLSWTGAAAQPQTVDIAGNWKCTPDGLFGPG